MTEAQQALYDEGYQAYQSGIDESRCPYATGYMDAPGEFWCDGWADALDDALNEGQG